MKTRMDQGMQCLIKATGVAEDARFATAMESGNPCGEHWMVLVVGDSAPRQRVEFAGFRLDPGGRQLTKIDGTPVALNSRAFDTLLALVAKRGEILSKKSLLEAVWPNVVVEDNNINQAISAIRKALGDNQDRHQIIQTIPGRGYCFIADLNPVEEAPQQTPEEPGCSRTIVSVADYFLSG